MYFNQKIIFKMHLLMNSSIQILFCSCAHSAVRGNRKYRKKLKKHLNFECLLRSDWLIYRNHVFVVKVNQVEHVLRLGLRIIVENNNLPNNFFSIK